MRGSEGATDDEIEVGTHLSHQNASARRNDLVKRGLVKGSKEMRRTRSGHRAIVWVEGSSAPTRVRVRRPPNAKIRQTVRDLRQLTSAHPEATHLHAVIDWLAYLVGSDAEDTRSPAMQAEAAAPAE